MSWGKNRRELAKENVINMSHYASEKQGHGSKIILCEVNNYEVSTNVKR
jgi:hypothetical protein